MAPPAGQADPKGKAIAIAPLSKDPNPEFYHCSVCHRDFHSGHAFYVHQHTHLAAAAVLKVTPPPPNYGPRMRKSRYPNARYGARPGKEPVHPAISSGEEDDDDDEDEEEGEEVNSCDIGRGKGQGQVSTGNRFVHEAQSHQLYNRETSLIQALTKDLLREWSPMTASAGDNHGTSFRRTLPHYVPMERAPAHSGSSSSSSNEKLDLDLKL